MTDLQKEEILVQTRTICACREFSVKKKLCKLFKFIIDKALEGDLDSLKGYSIGLEVFDRTKDFKPENDPIVRIQVGRLRRSLELYYLKEGTNDKVRIIIPKGANIPQFILNEISEPITSEENKNYNSRRSTDVEKPTIAVLPFKNLTGDSEKDFFAVGFTEEVSIELTRYEDFQVLSCRPKSAAGEKLYTSSDFIDKLGAHFVIEGSIRINEPMVKISVKLTDAFTKEHLWAEQYRRDLSAIGMVELQENIAQQIIATIGGEYGLIPKRLSKESRKIKLNDIKTYDAILRYYYFQTNHTQEIVQQTFQALEQAITNDPNCGIIKAMLATMYGNGYMMNSTKGEETIEKMVALSNEALKLDPDNQFVRLVFAWTFFVQNNKKRFFVEIENALELNPNSPLRIGGIGFFLSLYGDWERGKVLLDKAMKFNLGFPSWYYGATSLYYYRIKDYERAYEEAFKYNVPLFWGPLLRAACLGQLKNNDAAQKELKDLLTLCPEFKTSGEYLINLYIKEKELADHVFEGLQKGGMEL